MSFSKIFFHKDREISKTSIFLSVATFILLILWPFQSLMAGTEFGWWTVPEFDVNAGVTVLFTLSALYVANHKLPGQKEVVTVKQFKELRKEVDKKINSVSGEK